MLRRITPEDRGKHLTSYDAAYLEWAQRQQLPLATLDTELRGAASAEGVRRLGK
ncbi:MAG TPA: type II toxin-antitoxin system VapC family toxin [Bryobacteraceae bacterium]